MSGSSSQHPEQAERIVVVCPNCQSSLRVRRVYVGHQVLCKQCNHTFPVREPAEPQSGSAVPDKRTTPEASPYQPDINNESPTTAHLYDRLQTEHQRLVTAYHQLQAEASWRAAERDRDELKYQQVSGELGRVTSDLDRIRAHLGTVAPEDVRSLAQERESLRAEVNRLGEANQILLAEKAAQEHLASELEQRVADLATARSDLDSLGQQLKQRDDELTAARAESSDLSIQLRSAHEEVDQLRTTLVERDRSSRDESDTLRAQLQILRRALDSADESHRLERDRIDAELRAQVESLRGALSSADESHRLERDRINAELRAEVESLRGALDSAHDSHRLERDRISAELTIVHDQLRELRDQTEVNPAPEPSASVAEIAALRAQVEDLNRQLAATKRNNRDMVDMLAMAGIRPIPR